jgi:hypothetical protein
MKTHYKDTTNINQQKQIIYCHVYEWLQAGFVLVTRFIEHLYTYTLARNYK